MQTISDGDGEVGIESVAIQKIEKGPFKEEEVRDGFFQPVAGAGLVTRDVRGDAWDPQVARGSLLVSTCRALSSCYRHVGAAGKWQLFFRVIPGSDSTVTSSQFEIVEDSFW